jgi:hypothetical protein
MITEVEIMPQKDGWFRVGVPGVPVVFFDVRVGGGIACLWVNRSDGVISVSRAEMAAALKDVIRLLEGQ